MPGAIPIAPTLAVELGDMIAGRHGNIGYRYLSDYPFASRAPRRLDAFEREALTALRRDPHQRIYRVTGSIFDRSVRLVTPVVMEAGCVSCHNAHPGSPKRDWKVGDVRGLQEFTARQPITASVFAFKYLLLYLALAATAGLSLVLMQRRQARAIGRINRELEAANAFLAGVSMKVAKYVPPQLFRGIFSGDKDVSLATERKKLTIFFSDIADFTAASERLQPEELTTLLNEYLTEMSQIAHRHGGTIDKFMGDAVVVFFGDPDTRGVIEDARACLRMAIELRQRLGELNERWRQRGIQPPLRVRMGINTGYCNVGNFGSSDRMDCTIIGAEADLAARLQAIAEPDSIVISHETYALVRDIVQARPRPPITVKGISRPVVPYVVEGPPVAGRPAPVISEHARGVDIFVDTAVLDEDVAERARRALQDALAALQRRRPTDTAA